jgi:hypothetical protein
VSDKPEVKLPVGKSAGDYAHLISRAGISSLPLIGSAALELFNAVIAQPIERRRDEWMAEVADTLNILQEKFDLLPETLAKNEAFVTFVMHASQVAMRTHEEQKLRALKNAVINAALDTSPHAAKQHLFLRLIDDLAAPQLVLLQTESAAGDHVKVFFGEQYGSDEWLALEMLQDLGRRGLATVSGVDWPRGRPGGSSESKGVGGAAGPERPPVISYERTKFGNEFVTFISEVKR